jgi:hypothetical protein
LFPEFVHQDCIGLPCFPIKNRFSGNTNENKKQEDKARMSWIEGRIISGEYDNEMNVFTIQKLKQFFVESVLQPHQLQHLSDYLKNHQNEEEGQILILYDQMPVKLSQEEIKQFIADLDEIQSRCKGFT